jgi:hypothetical protein
LITKKIKMKSLEAILSVKFGSALSQEKLTEILQEDLDTFRSVPGLLQKYYIAEESTGALCGFYIFETKEARASFWNSELAKNIPARYGVVANTLRVEEYEMVTVLNEVLLA